jgi:hypothetical protein
VEQDSVHGRSIRPKCPSVHDKYDQLCPNHFKLSRAFPHCPRIPEMKRICLALFDKNNMMFGPYLTAIH